MGATEFNYRYGRLDLNKLVPVTFFLPNSKQDSQRLSTKECKHLGYLVKDGLGSNSVRKNQRVKCVRCGKRFGNRVNEFELNDYHRKVQEILYDIFLEGSQQLKMEKRWGIPQPKISRFKRSFVEQVFEQIPDLVLKRSKKLPRGLMYADETYLGKQGNSNTEIVFSNENFEILSTEGVKTPDLTTPITKAFEKISEKNRKRLRVLVTDGETTYCGVALGSNRRVIHVQQFHTRSKLGQITINKYENFGPHVLRYQIHTHWKIFKEQKQEFGFRWTVKFIKTPFQTGRGRPTKAQMQTKKYQRWRQKRDEYFSNSFKKAGAGRVFVNLETKKVTMKKGCKLWMRKIFQKLLPIFAGKCITNNRVESKHSQIKGTGKLRKQPDVDYCDKLFLLQEYIVTHKHLPPVNLKGRPLYKYLMKPKKKSEESYVISGKRNKKSQLMMSTFL